MFIGEVDPRMLLGTYPDPVVVACWLGALQLPHPDTLVVLDDALVELAIVCFSHKSPIAQA